MQAWASRGTPDNRKGGYTGHITKKWSCKAVKYQTTPHSYRKDIVYFQHITINHDFLIMNPKLIYLPPQTDIFEEVLERVICGSPDVPGSGGEGVDWEDD